MKFKFLLVTLLVVFGAGSVSNLSGTVRYLLENKAAKSIFIGYCLNLQGSQVNCNGGMFDPNDAKDFGASPQALVSVYWAEAQNSPKNELKLNNTEFTKFTFNPDGSIVGSK